MFRNQYDSDVTTWSPQGRLFQLEYAMEAVKQGSATVGLKSNKFAIICALKRAQNDLCDHQTKILPVSQHCGMSMSGLTSDGRNLCNFMRQECLNEEFVYDRDLALGKLLATVAEKMQRKTQIYDSRPYGVGLLVAGYDENGPHIYETCPSANYYDCKAMAIGARSQSARTFIEKHLDKFGKDSELNIDDLVKKGLEALRETLPQEQELTTKNISIGVVGENQPFKIYDNEEVKVFLELLDYTKKPSRSSGTAASASATNNTTTDAAAAPADNNEVHGGDDNMQE